MLADTQTSETAIATTPVQATSADPWDAPYFGGPVYFRYPDFPGASQAAQAPASTPVYGSTPADPSPAALAVSVEAVTESSTESADEAEFSAPALSPATSASAQPSAKPRRSWLARLFGRG